MSLSKKIASDPVIVAKVLQAYLDDPEKPTIATICAAFKTTYHTIMAILRANVAHERMEGEKKLRYSRSKMGAANPMRGKTGTAHHNWKGECSDHKGHLTILVDGTREFVHRMAFAQALGISIQDFPSALVVHHIDENPLNNHIDNLAICTHAGHRALHAKRTQLQKSPIWAQWQSSTSKSPTTTATSPTDL